MMFKTLKKTTCKGGLFLINPIESDRFRVTESVYSVLPINSTTTVNTSITKRIGMFCIRSSLITLDIKSFT